MVCGFFFDNLYRFEPLERAEVNLNSYFSQLTAKGTSSKGDTYSCETSEVKLISSIVSEFLISI